MGTNHEPPLVSVVVATYNRSSVLRYALLSAQAQTLPNFEVLVIGDGCSDDSEQVVASLADSRFKWHNLPVNSGHQSAPNNRGIELAQAEWIAYLGHDDLWMPNHLELLLRRLQETSSDVAFSLATLIGAPGCDGRMLFPVFSDGQYERGSAVPPSTLIHRRSLMRHGNWPDHRETLGAPEQTVVARFFDSGARFAPLLDVTVFKFPSSWRPRSYTEQNCDEQARFFRRMQEEPDFLHRELIQLALATQLLTPHTRVPGTPPEDNLRPGAVIEGYRRTRGLTSKSPEQGEPRYVVTSAMARLIDRLANDEIQRRQLSEFAMFEMFWAKAGEYSAENSKRTVVPIGRWARIRVPLEHSSEGAPLRIDPCDRPAIIELAWAAVRRNGQTIWSARRNGLDALSTGGDASRINLGRVLTIRSRGIDPIFFLPRDVVTDPPVTFECWIRIRDGRCICGR